MISVNIIIKFFFFKIAVLKELHFIMYQLELEITISRCFQNSNATKRYLVSSSFFKQNACFRSSLVHKLLQY